MKQANFFRVRTPANDHAHVYKGGFGGNGGDGGDIMELRVQRLEEDMREVKNTLSRLEPLIVRIDERQKHLPTNTTLIISLITIFAAGLAIPQLSNIIAAFK